MYISHDQFKKQAEVYISKLDSVNNETAKLQWLPLYYNIRQLVGEYKGVNSSIYEYMTFATTTILTTVGKTIPATQPTVIKSFLQDVINHAAEDSHSSHDFGCVITNY